MKPNRQQVPGLFDDMFVSAQLEASGTMAYLKLTQLGYPIKIQIAELFQKLQPYLEQRHISIGANNCCKIFLFANKFMPEDFKFGKTEIHFRPGKFGLLDQMNNEFQLSNNCHIAAKFRTGFISFMRRILSIRIRFISACELI